MRREWRFIAESRRGSSHESDGSPCQDACAATLLGDGDDQCLVACVADGAGSSGHSDRGAAEACRAVLDRTTAYHTEHQGLRSFGFDAAREVVRHARERVLAQAEEQGLPPREFASTLLTVVATPERACVFQIGDGAVILGRGGVLGVAFWPQSGEYANTTNFLTGDRFEDDFEFAVTGGPIDQLALFTDGLERLALVFENQTPHGPFCGPLFAGLQAADDLEQLGRDLGEFLDSAPIRERSDDDKSLVLAARVATDDKSGPTPDAGGES